MENVNALNYAPEFPKQKYVEEILRLSTTGF